MKRNKSILLFLLLLAFVVTVIFIGRHEAAAGQSIQKIETRPGVTIKFLLDMPDAASKGTLLLFPGSHGEGHFSVHNGQIILSSNFLVRTSPVFVQKGFAVAIIDVPSDQEDGMSDNFRRSSEHEQDIRKIIEFLKEKNLDRFYLVGTSRGTISAAYLATVLKEEALKGVVLTSTMGSQFVGGLPLDKISIPVLLMHHRDDGCSSTPFAEAFDLKRRFKGSPKVDFIEVYGGSSPEDSLRQSGKHGKNAKVIVNPCKAMSHHGYIGIEDKAVNAITDWLSGKPVPPEVGQ
jgi:hypothetical protein